MQKPVIFLFNALFISTVRKIFGDIMVQEFTVDYTGKILPCTLACLLLSATRAPVWYARLITCYYHYQKRIFICLQPTHVLVPYMYNQSVGNAVISVI